VAGYVGIPPALGGHERIAEFLDPTPVAEAGSHALEWILMAGSVLAAGVGLLLAYVFYVLRPELPVRISQSASALYSILTNKYYVDEIYEAILVLPIVVTSRQLLWQVLDVGIIDGTINGIGTLVRSSADGLRRMQVGYVRAYAGWILFGSIVIIAWFLR
jgi:NADH-quinone oxidoreductase subunit L